MLEARKEKEPTKAEALKKAQAWQTLNKVLVQTNAKFMNSLASILTERQVQHSQLKEKLDKGEGTEEENAQYLFMGGYIQCLKDILKVKEENV